MQIRAPRMCSVAVVLVFALTACSGDEEAIIGQSDTAEVGEVTLTSDDSSDSVQALCVSDIPEDLTTCPGAPGNLGRVELDQTLKATLVVPREVATGGYRLRVNGQPLPRQEGVLNELNEVLRFEPADFAVAGETVLTIEALRSREHPRAIWQFLLDEPGEQPG